MYKLGIDVGGTFTDFFLVGDDGSSLIHKTLSTPEDSSIGFITGIQEIAEKTGKDIDSFISEIETIVHGTTVGTNALLTQKGSKTALITTKGFRDALEMRRGVREERYNNRYKNATPLVPRQFRFTIDERIDAEGNILTPVNTTDLDPVIHLIKDNGIEAIAICFMNSYINHSHEQLAVEYLRKQIPELFISASFEVLPSVRFYERISTTCVNAYIGVVMDRYLKSLLGKLKKLNFKGQLLIMQSNGGVVTPEIASRIAAVTALSGPAAAPIAGAYYAELLGYKNCITMDMGGTSFDASLVVNGQCVTSTECEINRYRIALPTLDIVTIGAGGGSIGWLDSGGLLKMGPQSAGSLPGPVSYNRGGEEPACTDADLLLGYLDPTFFSGGKYKLNKKKTIQVTDNKLGKPLKLSAEKAAAGMYRVINMNMAQGVRQVSVERGYDPREFLMICAGGAGAIHAGEICRELEIPLFIVPDVAPIFCAAGMLLGNIKHDFVRSYMCDFANIDKKQYLDLYDQMKNEATTMLLSEGIAAEKIEFFPSLDLRYEGQYHEVPLQISMNQVLDFKLDEIKNAFHAEHNRQFGYELSEEGTSLQIINLRLLAVGSTGKPLSILNSGINKITSLNDAYKGNRLAYIPEVDEMREIPVYNGDMLSGSSSNNKHSFLIKGAAIIEQINTAIFIGKSYHCQTGVKGAFVVYNHHLFPNGILKNHMQKRSAAD